MFTFLLHPLSYFILFLTDDISPHQTSRATHLTSPYHHHRLRPSPDAYTLLGRTNAARRGVRASAPARGRATVCSRSNRASAARAAAAAATESPISLCAAFTCARAAAAAKRWHIWRWRCAAIAATRQGQGHDDRSAGAV